MAIFIKDRWRNFGTDNLYFLGLRKREIWGGFGFGFWERQFGCWSSRGMEMERIGFWGLDRGYMIFINVLFLLERIYRIRYSDFIVDSFEYWLKVSCINFEYRSKLCK